MNNLWEVNKDNEDEENCGGKEVKVCKSSKYHGNAVDIEQNKYFL